MAPRWRLILHYVADWVFIIALAVAVKVLSDQHPRARPFSLTNPNISFPHTLHETVPAGTLMIILALTTIPGLLLGSILPALWYSVRHGPKSSNPNFKSAVWRRAVWEFHICLLGLAATVAFNAFLTEGMKIIFGKPRPDCLARCEPDLARVADFVVGGFADQAASGQLVSRGICTGGDLDRVEDGFKSFPSGHSSNSAAGFGFLSLYLAGKFGVLSLLSLWDNNSVPSEIFARVMHPGRQHSASGGGDTSKRSPQFWLVVVAMVPYVYGLFVACSRWLDYRHHSIDILTGFTMGSIIAALGYRFSQLHLARSTSSRPVAAPQEPDSHKEWRPIRATVDDEEALDHRGSVDPFALPKPPNTEYRPPYSGRATYQN